MKRKANNRGRVGANAATAAVAVGPAVRRVLGYISLLLALFVMPGALIAQTNVITTVAGQGVALVSLSLPTGVAVDAVGNLYVADTNNCVIQKISNGASSVFAGIPGNCSPGSGTNPTQLSLQYPIDVVSCNGNVYFATHGFDPILTNSGTPSVGGSIYEIDASGNLTTLPTPSATPQSGATFPVALACDRNGNVFVSSYFYLAEITFYGSVDEIPAGSQTTQNWISLVNTAYPGITVDGNGDLFALQTSSVLKGWLGVPSFSQGGSIVELFSSGGSSTEQTISTGGQLTNPSRLTLDANGNFYVTQAAAAASPTVYVTSVPQFGGAQTTFAGNGIAGFSGDGLLPTHAELNNPTGMVFDGCDSLYIADASNGRVRKVLNSATASSASCTTGTSGPGGASGTTTAISLTSSAMQVTAPQTISFYSTVFVNNCFSCSGPLQGEVSFCAAVTPSANPCGPGGVTIGTVLVNGSSSTALTNYSFLISANLLNYSFPIPGTYSVAAMYSDSLTDPNGVIPSSTSTPLTVTVCGASCTDPGIPNIPISTYPVALTPGVLSTAFSGLGAVAFDASGNRYFLNGTAGTVTRFDMRGGSTVLIPSVGFPASLNNPSDMVAGSDGNLYITDTGNNQVVKVVGPATTTPTVSVITPTPALAQGLSSPTGIFETGAEVYVSDTGNNRVVALRPDGTFPSMIFSSATPGAPVIGSLQGIVVNPISLQIYIANAPASGRSSPGNIIVTSIGGSASVLGTPGVTLQSPFGLAIDPSNGIYFSDTGTHQIYRMDVHGNILVVAGNGTTTPIGEGVSATQTGLMSPTWLALDLSNSIWFADIGTLPPSVRQVDVTQALVDFTASGQSQTIYLTSPVSGVQGSVGFALPSPLITGSGSADFSVSSSSPCLSIFPVLSPNTSCALVVTLNTAGLGSTAYIDFQSEIEISTGSFNPSTALTQVITLNGAPSAGTTPLTLTPTSLGGGAVGVPYGPLTIRALGGGGQVAFTVSSGVLPPGLTLSSAGVLSGTPTQFSIFSFTITAKDANGDSGSQFYSVAISTATMTVPNVVGQAQATATTNITSAGLVVSTVTTASSTTVAAGNVISESPVAGTQVTPGSAVNLVVSTGPANVAVPDVVGQAQATATTNITGAGLVVGAVTTSSSTTVAAGNVISESPAAGTQITPGSAVSLVVSAGSPPPSPQISSVTPNIGYQGQQGLSVNITGTNFVVGATTVTFGGAGITVTSLTVTPTSAIAVLNIDPATVPGNYDVVLTVSGAPPPATLPGGFTVAVTINVQETIMVMDTPFVAPPYTVTGIAAPVANYSAGSLGFVGVAAGQTLTQTLTLSNVGLQPLVISVKTITQDSSNSFSVTQVLCSDGTTSITETILSGAECTLTISYTAPASGTPSGSITFTDNAALSNLASTASGSSFTQTLALSTTASTTAAPAEPATTIPISITEPITVMDTAFVAPPYTVTGIVAPVANYSAGSLGFVGVAAGQTLTQTLTLSNVGLQPLVISVKTITQDSSNSFSVTQVLCSDGTTSITETILSGAECTLTISYTAPASGTPSGSITFTDNAALSNLASTASGSSFTQTLALSTTVSTTAAPAEPPTTIPISITEPITVSDQISVTVSQINQMSQTITFGPAPSVLVGGTGTVSASASSGLPVNFGSTTPGICTVNGNVVTGVGVGQCVVTANQLGNTQYLSAPQVLQTVPIGSTQTITFSPTALPFGGTATLVATATSGLPVSFGLVSGNCTVSGDTVSTPGGGVCVAFASQLGNAQYLPAPNVTQTIRIERPQAITFTSFPASLAIGASAAFTATSSAGRTGTGGLTGLPVTVTSTTLNICTVSGSTVTGVAAGTCVLAGNQAGGTGTSGGAPFEPAPQVTVSIPVGASQRITFGAAPAPIPTGSTGTASATASSGLPVFYGTTTPGNCMIGLAINGVVNVTGVSAGSCVVTANQPGNATYAPAPQVTQTVTIGTTQTISFSPTILSHGGTATLVATATSGLPVSFGLVSGNCTVSGDTVSTPGGGVCVAFASQLGNAQYLPAPNVTQTIRIERPQAITFTSFPASLAIGASAAFTATSSAGRTGTGGLTGLPVTVTSTTLNICTVSGSTVTGVAAGTCVLAGNQAGGTGTSGGAPFEPAPQVTVSIPVGASQRITFGATPAPIPTGSTGTASATASSGLPVFYGTTTPGNCMIGLAINGVVNVTGASAGTCVVTANQPGNATYAPAPQVTQTVTIGTTQTISFSPTILLHGGTATLVATATSGLPVSFGLVSGNCTVSGDTVSTPGGGVCVVGAAQSGNAQYLPATPAIQTIRIERPQAITFTSFPASLAIGASAAFTATSSAGRTGTGGLTGLPVTVTSTTLNICTVSGSTVTGVAAGTCVLAGNQAGGTGTSGGAPFEPAPQVTVSIPVGASQRITFGAAPAPIPTGSTGTASATASSGLPVFYGTTTPGNCMIGLAINGVVNVTGASAGTCVVTANQPGNATYAPAPQVTQTVTIGTTQTISFSPTALPFGGTATLVATATSGLPVSFFVLLGTSSNCTVSGTTVSTPSGGNCVVVASQSGNAQYLPAPNVTQTIRIEQNQTITFATFPASLADGASGVLGAASSRGLPVNFSSLSPSICTVIGNTVTGVSAGSCVVAANAAAGVSSGGIVIEPAPQVTETIPVGSNQTTTFGAAPLVLVGGTGTVSATASSGLPVSFGSLTPGICTVSGNVVTGVSFGACIVTANQGGNAQYLPARQVTQTITD